MLNSNDMDSSPCAIHSGQTTTRTHHNKYNTNNENNRLINQHNCNDKCNCNNDTSCDMGLSGNRIPKYCHKFGLHYTQLCILIFVACISFTYSAPTTHHQLRHRRENKLRDWLGSKCPSHPTMSQNDAIEYNTQQMKLIFDAILDQCQTALTNAEGHAYRFSSIRWLKDITQENFTKEVVEPWAKSDGSWLHPDGIQKFHYNETIPSDIKTDIGRQLQLLDKEDSKKLVIDMYNRFMLIAYGIQIIIDDHSNNTIYQDNKNYELAHIYNNLKENVNSILCEINEGIMFLKLELELPQRLDADNFNDKKIVRDWIIYREYMSLLSFIKHVYNNEATK